MATTAGHSNSPDMFLRGMDADTVKSRDTDMDMAATLMNNSTTDQGKGRKGDWEEMGRERAIDNQGAEGAGATPTVAEEVVASAAAVVETETEQQEVDTSQRWATKAGGLVVAVVVRSNTMT